MQPDQTPRQPETRQPDDFPPVMHQPPRLGAGECGDAIWEDSAFQGGTVDASAPVEGAGAEPGQFETGIRGGRFIDLQQRRPRREPPNS